MALEEVDGVTGAFVNGGVTLHLATDKAPDEEKLKEILKEFKMVLSGMEKAEELPF